ncbi:MAG: TolC family protein [Thermoanaerobaculia bacterium]
MSAALRLGTVFLGMGVLAACATTQPRGAFEATAKIVAGRHPGEVPFRPDDAASARIETRVQELLAAPLTAEGAAEVALLRNPFLQARLEELGIAQADLAQATRLSNPGLSFTSISGGGQQIRTVSLVTDFVDLLVQPLRRKLAEAELERVKLEVGQAILATAAGARIALIRLQAGEQMVRSLGPIAEIDQAALDYAEALFVAGNITSLERANAGASWAEARAQLGWAQAEAARRREAVLRATGLASREAWTADTLGELEPLNVDLEVLQGQALASRLDLAAARWAVDALSRALALKRRTRLFPLGVEVGVERETEPDGVHLTGPIVSLRLPLFDTGKASVARLDAELARARWQLRGLEDGARSEVREKASDLAAAFDQEKIFREDLLPLRREVLDLTLREYNAMLIGTFHLVVARQAELESERRHVEALEGYWIARAELERAVGGGRLGSSEPARGEASDLSPQAHKESH